MVYCWRQISQLVVLLLVVNCSPQDNESLTEELVCSGSTDTWFLTSVSCNGSTIGKFSPTSFVIDGQVALVTAGAGSCLSTVGYDLYQSPSLEVLGLVGATSYGCFSAGVSVDRCQDALNHCNTSESLIAIRNTFTTCAIRGGAMNMTRTVTNEQVDAGISYCNAEETERLGWSLLQPNLPTLVNSEGDDYDFLAVQLMSSSHKLISLTNSSLITTVTDIGVNELAVPFSYSGGLYPGTSGTCTTILAPGQTCTIEISFAPVAEGAAQQELNINYNDGGNGILTIELRGTGVP